MTTVGELYDRYRPLILSNISPGTGRAYTYAWGKRVGPTFGARDIEQISTLEVELAVASWSGAYSTRVDALSLLSRICRTAIKGGIIPTNPCVGVERPRTQDSDPTSRALNLEQIELLLEALPQSGAYRRFVLAMLYTGCRLGEIAALRPADVDWATNTTSAAPPRRDSPGNCSSGRRRVAAFAPSRWPLRSPPSSVKRRSARSPSTGCSPARAAARSTRRTSAARWTGSPSANSSSVFRPTKSNCIGMTCGTRRQSCSSAPGSRLLTCKRSWGTLPSPSRSFTPTPRTTPLSAARSP